MQASEHRCRIASLRTFRDGPVAAPMSVAVQTEKHGATRRRTPCPGVISSLPSVGELNVLSCVHAANGTEGGAGVAAAEPPEQGTRRRPRPAGGNWPGWLRGPHIPHRPGGCPAAARHTLTLLNVEPRSTRKVLVHLLQHVLHKYHSQWDPSRPPRLPCKRQPLMQRMWQCDDVDVVHAHRCGA